MEDEEKATLKAEKTAGLPSTPAHAYNGGERRGGGLLGGSGGGLHEGSL